MKNATIFLKTPLFALKGDEDPIPTNAIIVEGDISEENKGGVVIEVSAYFSIESKSPAQQSKKPLKGKPARLFIPSSKIDHIRLS